MDDAVAADLLGPDFPHLSETLGRARERARGLVKGWAFNMVGGPGFAGSDLAGGLCIANPPSLPTPASSKPPVSMCLPAAWAKRWAERAVRHQARCEPPVS